MKGKIVNIIILLVGLIANDGVGNHGVWTQLPTSNFPSMRSGYAMAYDSFHKKIIAYGGRTGFRSDFQNVNETWSFDYKTNIWTNLVPENSPPWRSSHAMVYDPQRNRILMFGGNDFTRVFNDLWEYDYGRNIWTNLSLSYSPEARQMHGMVYVPGREVVIMYGGRRLDGGASFADTWEFNCKTSVWTKLNPQSSPPVSDHVNITYDGSVKKVILFARPDTWAYDFDTENWTNLNPTNSPDSDHSSFVYDPHHEKSVLFGNSKTSDGMFTWVFDFSENSWTNITPQFMPVDYVIEHDGMVYLNDRNVFIQYGGCCSDNTLELTLN